MRYQTAKLGNHVQILSGFAFKSKDFSDEGVPVIKIKNVTPPSVSLIDLSYVSEEIAEKNKKFVLEYDDVLIALTGSHINQMASVVGRVARVKYSEKTVLNQRVGKITAINPNDCDIDFVYYYLSQDQVKIELASKAGGAANQANISPTDIMNLMIPFPEIGVQRKISAVLRTYDDLIENNQKQIKLLEEAAQRLYKEWFVDLRFPGHETTPITDGIPEGWSQGVLGDVVVESGRKISKDNREGYSYYLPIDCLPKKSLGYIATNEIALAESSLVAFAPRDIIFGAMRPYFHKVVVARDSGITRTTCFVLNTGNPAYWAYAVMLMFSSDTVDYATQISVGTTMPYTRWKDFKSMPIIVPSEECAMAFGKEIDPIITKINGLAKQIVLLQQARDRLLPKLMNGEIEV